MKRVIRWAVHNTPAMNTLTIAVVIVGITSMFLLRRETFPQFKLEIVLVTVPYPGASPAEVEDGICQKIEEEVRSIDGMKKITSVAREGGGYVICELKANVKDPQRVLNDVRSSVDRIPSFPRNAEDPVVQQISLDSPAIRLAIISDREVAPGLYSDPDAERQLRDLAESIRDELLLLDKVSLVEVVAEKPYQIDIEIPESVQRAYGGSLEGFADVVRRRNMEMPGGKIQTPQGELLVRGENKRREGAEIAKLPLITQDKAVVTVGDVANVRDGFDDVVMFTTVNGKRAVSLEVRAAPDEDLLAIVDQVHQYVAEKTPHLPEGFSLAPWLDTSVAVRDRMELLTRNGISGLLAVFVILSIFLNLRLAFWVAWGIPFAVLGTCAVMLWSGETLNMISMFGFVMALGIVVDDAIVVGENVFRHRQMGKSPVQAAIDGAAEVAPSVFSSVATTVVAFLPLFFVSGIMGKFIAVMPLAVVAMLVISLFESTFILPCHLAHSKALKAKPSADSAESIAAETLLTPIAVAHHDGNGQLQGDFLPRAQAPPRGGVFAGVVALFRAVGRALDRVHGRFRRGVERFMNFVIGDLYVPALRWTLNHLGIAFSLAVGGLLLCVGLIGGGFTPFELFPKLDNEFIRASITYADGTPPEVTDESTRRLEQAIHEAARKLTGRDDGVVKLTFRQVGTLTPDGAERSQSGGHVGEVWAELDLSQDRQALGRELGVSLHSQDIINAWREEAGEFPGVDSLRFGELGFGPGGKAVEFKLLGDDIVELRRAAQMCLDELNTKRGVFDADHDSQEGKWELQLKVKSRAEVLGVTDEQIANAVRAAYFGVEVQRLQRGRHEVKLMVRYPPDERRSLANFREIMVRTPQGDVPITEVADVERVRSYSEINRIDQRRSITVAADVDSQQPGVNSAEIIADFKANFLPKLQKDFPNVAVRWEGEAEQSAESLASLAFGFVVAIFVMFVLLALEFRSYVQPLIILAMIPFGMIGAVLGHLVLGLSLTMFSMFGLVALAGIVVNDSIVFVDFINLRVREGAPLSQALIDAGKSRFRAIMLTSLTTIGGLMPLILETSVQAQLIVPMAVSITFGLMATTVMALFLTPSMYKFYAWCVGNKVLYEEDETADADVAPTSFPRRDLELAGF